MGTASLIGGIGSMLVGFAIIAQGMLGQYWTVEQMFEWMIFNLIVGIPFVAFGAFLLKKYDKDKKINLKTDKDDNPSQPSGQVDDVRYKYD